MSIQPDSKTDAASAAHPQRTPAALKGAELQPGDTYMEGPNLVFTAQYHLRRGYCCNSGCRHCPYKDGDGAQRAG